MNQKPESPSGPIKYKRLGRKTRETTKEEKMVQMSMIPDLTRATDWQRQRNMPEKLVVTAPLKMV